MGTAITTAATNVIMTIYNNYRNFEKKRRKSEKEIIKDILNRWDWCFYRYNIPL